MIIKASSRGGYRNLANHLLNTNDNDHVALHEIRGLAGDTLHSAFAEIDAISQGTRTNKPLFSVSFNPPPGEQVTYAQFENAFDKLENKLGLVDQPRAIVYHEKEGRRHAHVVWSRIDANQMKAIDMSFYKLKCTDISRELYRENNWQMPKGLEVKAEREPYQAKNSEWQKLKRKGIDPKELKAMIGEAWSMSDSAVSFKHALQERGLFLARGDKRGFVVIDTAENIHSLSRNAGLKSAALKAKLGDPQDLDSVAMTMIKIKSIYNTEMLKKISELKQQQKKDLQNLEEQKIVLVEIQKAERREQQDHQRIKRNLTIKTIRSRFRKGIIGFFDKVTGREKRLRLVGKKQLKNLKLRQNTAREKLIFKQNDLRSTLQQKINTLKENQRAERQDLTRNILDSRSRSEQARSKLRREFDNKNLNKTNDRSLDRDCENRSSKNDQEQGRKVRQERRRVRKRTLI